MSNKLIIATTAGLALSAAFLGLAVLIGGDDVLHDARSLKYVRPLIDLATHKTWHWNGGDTLALDAPVNIRYRPKGPPQVSVTGPEELLKHVRVTDGRIASDTAVPHDSGGRKLEAVVSGVAIRKFVVNGGENLDLGEVSQPDLDLHINGNGNVRGRGTVDRLKLTLSGPGKADLGGLAVMGDARISILGSGDAALSPHGKVRLFIAGSGKLRLLTPPAELHQSIIGSGEVNQLAGEAAKEALKSVDVARIVAEAVDAAQDAVNGAHIQQQIQRDVEQHMGDFRLPDSPPPAFEEDARTGSVVVPSYRNADLGHVERDRLSVTIASSGSLTAEGKVDRLTVNVMGSGHANLGKLVARRVTVMVMGSGSATVAPSERLTAQIMGSGDVHLLTHPAKIEREIVGPGHIIEEAER